MMCSRGIMFVCVRVSFCNTNSAQNTNVNVTWNEYQKHQYTATLVEYAARQLIWISLSKYLV